MTETAIITGGSRGIGRAITLALAEKGWRVVINYVRSRQAAEAALSAVETAGGQGIIVQADVSSLADHAKLVAETLDAFGRIDLLVNNAGVAPRERSDLLGISPESYDRVLGINLRGPFFLTQRVASHMIAARESGDRAPFRIININSISAYVSSPARGQYCISKAGLGMVTALFADRLSAYEIGVYEIRPGIIQTDMTRVVKDKYDHFFAEGGTPLTRWGMPEDVARAVASIVDGDFPYSTGEVFNVDGGFHLRRL
jgi:3-oxoacyl-[acyl-carrier protein] reductase